MFDIETGWLARLSGGALPNASGKTGWIVDHSSDPAFVEPSLKVLEGDPETARIIVVAAPGAVGKSTYARTLGARASAVVVDLAKTEPLGGNFFVGGLANAFGYKALTEASEGRLALIVDALDEAQLRSGVEGFSAGLLDLGSIIRAQNALPAALFGRASAATEAWLVLSEAGLAPCLLEIEFFDEPRAASYIARKLPVIADRRPKIKASYERYKDRFVELAVATRAKLLQTSGGDDVRFAGYAPVLDAICEFAMDEDDLNPQARAAELSAREPVALIEEIAKSILVREQVKLLDQLRAEVSVPAALDLKELYTPSQQLARIATVLIGSPATPLPAMPTSLAFAREPYERMVTEFAPQHPFLDGRGGASNVAFAAYVLVWCLTANHAAAETRRALEVNPGLGSGLFFELYMMWLAGRAEQSSPRRALDLADIGALYASLASQASRSQQPKLDVTGEPNEATVEVEFEMVQAENGDEVALTNRLYGPFEAAADSLLEIRGALAGIRIVAPLTVIIGDGTAVNITAPVQIDVDTLEIDARELRVFRSASHDDADSAQVEIAATDASVERVERIVLHGGQLTVSFPGSRLHPWNDYAASPPEAPNEAVEEMRRRLRRILTSFRSHSKGSLVRLAAKIDHARMMKKGDLGPRLMNRLMLDGIITSFDAGKFYTLHTDKMAEAINMDYQALQQQRWSPESDKYLNDIAQ